VVEKAKMIRTQFKNRFRGEKSHDLRDREGRAPRHGPASRRESGHRRENSTVVHPWMSLPERLAQAQAAMSELAGVSAFSCPLDSTFTQPPAELVVEPRPRPAEVSVTIRKRRLPVTTLAALTAAS
jgi:hypothetical protein